MSVLSGMICGIVRPKNTEASVKSIIEDMPDDVWKKVRQKGRDHVSEDLSDEQKAACSNHLYELVRHAMVIRKLDDLEMQNRIDKCYGKVSVVLRLFTALCCVI